MNTGDDMDMFGLHISPDIDIVAYTLAGIVDEEKGWGIKGDTFQCLEMIRKMGLETWFSLGDKDFATHIFQNNLLNGKVSLFRRLPTKFADALGLKVNILPMTDDKFETWIKIEEGLIHFEEYFVKRQAKDKVLGVEFVGAAKRNLRLKLLIQLLNAEMIVICPSNPVVSIGTILSVDGIRDALKKTNAEVVGVSPIVAGAPIKGPADKLMRGFRF